MKLTKSQLKQIIKEECRKALKEARTSIGAKTTLITSDKKKHELVIDTLEAGYYEDMAQGGLAYRLDGEDFEWEFHSGYYPEGAAYNILSNLDDEDNEQLEGGLSKWLEELDLVPETF